MQVFTYYDPDLESEPVGPIIRLWELSWRANGWAPRLLVPHLAHAHPNFREDLGYWQCFDLAAQSAHVSGICVDFRSLNNGLRPEDISALEHPSRWNLEPGFAARYPFRAKVVIFSRRHSLDDMLALGPYDLGQGQEAK